MSLQPRRKSVGHGADAGAGILGGQMGPSGTEGDVYIEQEDDLQHVGILSGSSLKSLSVHAGWCSRLVAPACLVVFGYLFLKCNEGWSLLTTAYVMVQIVTTIGYGDVVVEQESSMLFMTFFSLAMLIVVAFNLDFVIQKLYAAETRIVTRLLRDVEDLAEGEEHVHDTHASLNKLLSSLCIAAILAIFGTCFYSSYEKCTCSTDVSLIEGCMETTYKECVATGGSTKSLISTIYMVVMTFTTIGFGDFSIESHLGRAIGTVWMLLCVASTAHLVQSINHFVYEKRTLNELLSKDILEEGKEVFDMIDKDGSGTLSRSEFIHYTLIKYGLVSEEVIDAIEQEYDRLDILGNEKVTFEMISDAMEARQKKREKRLAARRRASVM